MNDPLASVLTDSVGPVDLGPVTGPGAAPPLDQTPPKNKGGRPKGSRTRPELRRAAARPTSTATPSGARLAADAAEAAASALERETKAGRPSATAKESQAMQDGLQSFYVGVGAMAAVLGRVMGNGRLAATGEAMRVQGPECATALVAWSESNASVRKALQALTSAGGATLVMAAHAPIVAAAMSGAGPDSSAEGGEVGSVDSASGFDLGSLIGMVMQQP